MGGYRGRRPTSRDRERRRELRAEVRQGLQLGGQELDQVRPRVRGDLGCRLSQFHLGGESPELLLAFFFLF
jgi:hypothetical protein